MELSLNLAWLLLATTSGAVLGWRVFRAKASSRPFSSKWHFVVALGLSLVILFFVISMTDDLHEQQSIAEESGSSRVLPATCCAASSGKHFARPGFSQAILADILRYSPTSFCVGQIEEPRVLDFSAIQCPPIGRAPPALPA
jgi:hypothetical protein